MDFRSYNDVKQFQLGDLVEKPSYTEKMEAEVMMMIIASHHKIAYHKNCNDDHIMASSIIY